MLRHLGQTRDDGTPYLRKGEKDADDSVFLVLLGEDVGPAADGTHVRSWMVASAWTMLGEAQAAANRYITEGHKAHHGWTVCMVMEYQTGQLAPMCERHGDEMRPPRPDPTSESSRLEELELEVAKLRARLGQSQSVGVSQGVNQ